MHEAIDYIDLTRRFYEKNAAAYAANTATLFDLEWLQRFVEIIPAGGSILDVGCASGRDAGWFAERGFQVHGIDISEAMIDIARMAYNDIGFDVMNLLDLRFADNFFDGIWCSCVLLHISHDDLSKALSEMHRVLKSNGCVYILVKEGTGEGVEKDSRYGGDEKFSSYFTPAELRSAFGNAQFEVVDFTDLHRKVDDYRASDRMFALIRRTD